MAHFTWAIQGRRQGVHSETLWHPRKLDLIESVNPQWRDLAEGL
jgi:hypothetical protein